MRTRYTLLALSLLSTLSATELNDARNMPILQKCARKPGHFSKVSVELYGQWLFLQPNASNLYYAAEAFPFNTTMSIPEVSPNWRIFEIEPDYQSGFEVGAKFMFPNYAMSLEVNWERFHAHDSASMNVAVEPYGTGNMVGPLFDIGPNSAVYKKAKGNVFFHFDVVDVVFGKTVCFNNDLKARFYAGGSFSRIKESLSAHFSNEDANIARSSYTTSTFIGAGPEFGMDFRYRLYHSLYFNGLSSVSLYMGELKNSTTYHTYAPELASAHIPQPNPQTTTVPSREQIVPGFVENLGFSYIVPLRHCELAFGIGYQFQIYLDAVQTIDMTAPQVLPSLTPGADVQMGLYAVGFERTISNFMLSGPYISFNIAF